MEEQRYRSQNQVSEISYYAYKEQIEMQFILHTLKSMPLDKLKKLINLKETDPKKMECNSDYDFLKKEELLRNRSIELTSDFYL